MICHKKRDWLDPNLESKARDLIVRTEFKDDLTRRKGIARKLYEIY